MQHVRQCRRAAVRDACRKVAGTSLWGRRRSIVAKSLRIEKEQYGEDRACCMTLNDPSGFPENKAIKTYGRRIESA